MEIGTYISDFVLTDFNGEIFESHDYRQGKLLVVYFYPKDFTPGCTKEACSFNEHLQEFAKYNTVIVGVSADSPEKHAQFIAKYNLKFPLLSDRDGILAEQFGVKKHLLGLIPGRETFIFDTSGKLQFKWRQLKAANHTQKALEAVKQLYHEQ